MTLGTASIRLPKPDVVSSGRAVSSRRHSAVGRGHFASIPAWLRACGALFAVAWGGNEFTPLLVMYREANGLTNQAVNVLLGAYVLGIVPALLIGGPLSDRYGRRPLMFPAPALAIVGSTLLALGSMESSLLFIGRVFSGLALGLVMAVGTSWVKELSQSPFDTATDGGTGARRASLALTAGFGSGAVVAALLAQFGPLPTVLPYLVNIVVTLILWFSMWGAPETRGRLQEPGRLRDDLKVPALAHRRFLFVVLPMAPWVFGTAASAYAILPGVMMTMVPGMEVGFSGLLCFVALSCGVASQQFARRLDSHSSARAIVLAMLLTIVGLVIAGWASAALSLGVAILAAAVLGAGYGLLLVSGLHEVQRIAGPSGLAGLTAVYYSFTYLGFFVPAILALLTPWFTYSVMFAAGAVIAALCLCLIVFNSRRHLPESV